MITEDYVSYETAKLLKEKGFNWDCKTKKFYPEPDYDQESPNGVYAPTLQMAMKWLREVHGLFIFISTWMKWKDGTIQYYYEMRNLNDDDFETLYDYTSKEINSYEKACEEAIKYCLEKLI